MGYGDAYIYAVIITRETAEIIDGINHQISLVQEQVDAILEEIDAERKNGGRQCNPERGKRGLALLDEITTLGEGILSACKSHLAVIHISSDDWLASYNVCDKQNYIAMPVPELLKRVGTKLWGLEDIMKFSNQYVVCIPSHYDIDEEVIDAIGGK